MTQEEKAKAYDVLLTKAKQIYNKENDVLIIHTIEDLFPKFRKNEDEKMKESCKFFLNLQKINSPHNILDIDKCITWLEKQDKQKPYGQRKECLDCQFNYAGECEGSCQMKRDEQKPTDKVELKFHEGDFIKHNKACSIYRVISVNSGSYYVENIRTNNRIELFHADENFHLWTIADAKDGDILQLGFVTAIFQKRIGNNCKCYCSVCDGEFEIPSQDGNDNIYGCYSATPANKEQRDTLFAKMKEAGYIWIFSKKELIKVEQNPTKWSEEDERNIQNIDSVLFYDRKLPEDTRVKLRDFLKTLKERIEG